MSRTATAPEGLRARQARQVHDELLRAGLSLLVSEGYAGVTVEAIAQAAGVSTRTFFRYFASKDVLFTTPFVDLAEHFVTAMTTQPADANAWDAVRAACLESAAALQDDPHMFRLAAQVVSASPSLLVPSATRLGDLERAMVAEVGRRLPRRRGAHAHPERTAALVTGLATLAQRISIDAWIKAGDDADLTPLMSACLDDVGAGAVALCR